MIDFVANSGANGSAATGGALISPLLLDAFVAYKPFDGLKITAGQFNIPFSLENLTPGSGLLETAYRSFAGGQRPGRPKRGRLQQPGRYSVGNQNVVAISVIQLSGSLFKLKGEPAVSWTIISPFLTEQASTRQTTTSSRTSTDDWYSTPSKRCRSGPIIIMAMIVSLPPPPKIRTASVGEPTPSSDLDPVRLPGPNELKSGRRHFQPDRSSGLVCTGFLFPGAQNLPVRIPLRYL